MPIVSYSRMTGIRSTKYGKSLRHSSTNRGSSSSSRRRLSPSARIWRRLQILALLGHPVETLAELRHRDEPLGLLVAVVVLHYLQLGAIPELGEQAES